MKGENRVIQSQGNVFADLELNHPEEALAKAELARKISLLIMERNLTQREAGEVLGIDQAKVSALTRGQLRGFSTERLFRFLNALGQDIEIKIRPKSKSRAYAQVQVIAS